MGLLDFLFGRRGDRKKNDISIGAPYDHPVGFSLTPQELEELEAATAAYICAVHRDMAEHQAEMERIRNAPLDDNEDEDDF